MEVPGAGYAVSTQEGTPVTVTYDPRDPGGSATVADRGRCSPVPGSLAVVAGCGTAAVGFAVVLYFEIRGGS
ncbi:hypothetical protein [Streptomyces sp. TE5632]